MLLITLLARALRLLHKPPNASSAAALRHIFEHEDWQSHHCRIGCCRHISPQLTLRRSWLRRLITAARCQLTLTLTLRRVHRRQHAAPGRRSAALHPCDVRIA